MKRVRLRTEVIIRTGSPRIRESRGSTRTASQGSTKTVSQGSAKTASQGKTKTASQGKTRIVSQGSAKIASRGVNGLQAHPPPQVGEDGVGPRLPRELPGGNVLGEGILLERHAHFIETHLIISFSVRFPPLMYTV